MKTYRSNSQLVHAWANQLTPEGKASNIFFEGPTIYSYGRHYQIAKFVTCESVEKVVFVNSNGYSMTTAKHKNLVLGSIPDGIKVFKVPFVNNQFTTEILPDVIEEMLNDCLDYLKKQINAKTYFGYYCQAAQIFDDIKEITALFGIECPEKPENWENASEKSKKLMTVFEFQKKQRQIKREQKDLEKLEKWKKGEYNGNLFNVPIHFRIKNGKVETTKGASVSLSSAKEFLAKMNKGLDLIGEKIEGFTCLKKDNEFIQIGCHKISLKIVQEFFG